MAALPSLVKFRTLLLALAVVVSSAFAQKQFSKQGKQHLPTDSDYTYAFALGDVDGDGDLDLVYGNDQRNRLLLNNGTGTFTDAPDTYLPSDNDTTYAVALGDVDGDRDLDLVCGNWGGPTRLYLNDGTGRFVEASGRIPATSDHTRAIALADVDNDQDLDLVVGNDGQVQRAEQDRLYLNDGRGNFSDATAARLPVDNDYTLSLAVGDVNGDGALDLVWGSGAPSTGGSQNRLYLNDGKGKFVDATALGLPADRDYTVAVALGDADGDLDLDLFCANWVGQNRLYLNDGKGKFALSTTGGMAKLNDISFGIALGDVDVDSDLDVVIGNHGLTSNRLLLNDGHASFVEATSFPVDNDKTRVVMMADVTRDGDLDLVVGNAPGTNRLYLGDGRGGFADGTASRFPRDVSILAGVASGDVNGDAAADLVFAHLQTQNRVYVSDGKGSFTRSASFFVPNDKSNTRAAILVDVDADGDLDIVFGNSGGQGMPLNRLYLNDGKGQFSEDTARLPRHGDQTLSLAAGDVDSDGDMDLVIGNNLDQNNRLYLNDGKGRFTDVTATQMPKENKSTGAVVLVDVDGDRDLDLVCGNTGFQAQNSLYLNDGRGNFTDVTASNLPARWDNTSDLAAGDVDGDGDADLVLANGTSFAPETNRVLLNDGKGKFTDAPASHMPGLRTRSDRVVVGDIDEDGDLDLIFGAERTMVYVNDGKGRFSDATAARLPGPAKPNQPRALELLDADGDGDLDLMHSDFEHQKQIYFNLHRQIHAPSVASLGKSYHLDVYARPGYGTSYTLAIPFVARAESKLAVPHWGTFGLDYAQTVTLPLMVILPATGRVGLDLVIPSNPAIAGKSLFSQALIIPDLAYPPVNWRFTNVTGDVVFR